MFSLAIASLSLTFILTCAAIYFVMTSTKKSPEEDGRVDIEEKKKHDQQLDIWYRFGFVDDTPNVFYQVVAGNERTGRPLRYFGYNDYSVMDRENGCIIEMEEWKVDGKAVKLDDKLKDEKEPFPKRAGDPLRDSDGPLLDLIRTLFGKRFYGIPFLQNVKPLTIDRVVFNSSEPDGRMASTELSASKVKRYGLYGEILRPTRHNDVDTKDNLRFTTTSQAKLRVFDAKPAFNTYPDNYLVMVSKLISSHFSQYALQLTYEEYKGKGNLYGGEQLKQLNEILYELGIKVIQLTFGDPQLNAAIQTSLEEQARARNTANALREAAIGKKAAAILISEGEAEAITNIAKARTTRTSALVQAFRDQGLNIGEASRLANDQVNIEFKSNAIRELRGTFVEGGAASTTLALSERRPVDETPTTPTPEKALVISTEPDWARPTPSVERPKGNRKGRDRSGARR